MYNPHEILGVEEGDNMSTIKQRFKTVSKIYHPDKHMNDKTAIIIYQIIRNAYDSLKESKKKIVLPVMDPQIVEKKESLSKDDTKAVIKQDSIVPGTNITENDIRILGERLNDPWFHPEFELTDFFGDVTIPEKNKKK